MDKAGVVRLHSDNSLANQTAPAGNYADTITVEVAY